MSGEALFELVTLVDEISDEATSPSSTHLDRMFEIARSDRHLALMLLWGLHVLEGLHYGSSHTVCRRCVAIDAAITTANKIVAAHLGLSPRDQDETSPA